MRRTSFVILVFALVGCGDDSSFDSGVPGNRPLGDLTEAESTQLCRSMGQYMIDTFSSGSALRMSCTLGGVAAESASGVAGQCEEIRDICMDEASEEPVLEFEGCDEAEFGELFESCEANVADLERCVSDISDTMQQVMNRVSCSLASDPEGAEAISEELERIFEGGGEPASCVELKEKCPDSNIFG